MEKLGKRVKLLDLAKKEGVHLTSSSDDTNRSPLV